ncbi:hypothetical protein RND81_08G188200 [Saponaria officinalis]|uniref:Selenoprotein H n=1 Tax=Saponaria officinalis TaxID=3572 RepID=A0AAW1J996_SAPOF
MPPTKRKASGGDAGAAVVERRVTRGQTRKLLHNSAGDSVPTPTPKEVVKKNKKQKKEESKTTTQKSETTTDEAQVESNNGGVAHVSDSKSPTVVIEHCKQCNRFKVRALQVQKGLEEGVPGITVLVNPEKPRRGCFEIRLEGGQTFISLLDMKRPFKPMTDLNMEEVIADILEKIKA